MGIGVVPGSSNTALRLTPTPTHLRSPAAAVSFWGGGGSGSFRLPQPGGGGGGWPRLSSSTFRTYAAIGEGARARARGSFYELLGISESGSFDDIKRAYKLMARKYHPDVSPPDRTEENTRRFIEVQEAYETLSDPNLRALYDRDLARGMHLAFSARRRVAEGLKERSAWRIRWQDQLGDLERRSRNKDSEGNLSWAAQMRRQRAESSTE